MTFTRNCSNILLVLLLVRVLYGISVLNHVQLVDGFQVISHTFVPTRAGSSSTTRIWNHKNDDRYNDISFDVLKGKRVLVVGGSGRVGGSVTTQLVQHGATVLVGGTNINRYEESKARWKGLFPTLPIDTAVNFCTINREDTNTILSVINTQQQQQSSNPIDLIVHTAGPFQGKVKSKNGILDASIQAQIPYIDVCDDYCTAMAAKTKYTTDAKTNGVPCIVSTGCWPGVSSLMVKSIIDKILVQEPDVQPDQDITVDFSFYTAGSGGAGVTLLVATFLILSEQALTIQNGRRILMQPMKDYSTKDFGPIIGPKSVAHLNLLETASIYEYYKVNSITSYFGTAPNFWNALLGFMVQLLPPEVLRNEDIMTKLSVFSLPIVRIVDYFAGSTNAMRCDVTVNNNNNNNRNKKSTISTTTEMGTNDDSYTVTALYGHEDLERCVGECIVSFACAVLTSGVVEPGIHFPEEAIPTAAVPSVLSLASIGAHTTDVSSTDNTNDKRIQWDRKDVWGYKVIDETSTTKSPIGIVS